MAASLLWACDDGGPSGAQQAADASALDAAAPDGAPLDASPADATPDMAPDASPPAPCLPAEGALDEAGGVLAIEAGQLAGAQVALPPGALPGARRLTLDCDAPIVPPDWVPVGAALRVAAPQPQPLAADARIQLVFDAAALDPAVQPNHLRLFWRADNSAFVRTPLVIDPEIDRDAGTFAFATPGLGTFQLGHRPGAGQPTPRRYSFKAITGVSMGGGGAAYLGVKYHDRFDFVGALGGPVDWPYMLQYISGRILGGFCSADAGDGLGGACPAPPVSHPWEHPSIYNDWFYADNGGSFDRSEYVKIFQDLSYAYGNPLVYNAASAYRAPGVTADRLRLAPARRCLAECAGPERAAYCAEQRAAGRPCRCDQLCPDGVCPEDAAPARIESGFYDDEYNPDGDLPVIAYCEGEDGAPLGVLNPDAPRDRPTEIMLAVDLNNNGRRDALEPVIRNLAEPYADVGCDGLASPDEPGYDPITNPDPSGDDYSWYAHGAGTEGNGWRDGADACPETGGEPFDDFGLDGVPNTPQSDVGGYDFGEGNGQHDANPHVDRYLERTPGLAWAKLPPEARDRLDFWVDGGIRDIFNFGVASLHMGARLQATGVNVRVYRDFPALLPTGSAVAFLPNPDRPDPFGQAGEAIVVVYGDPDADQRLIDGGDGAHVGSADQILNRFLTLYDWLHNRWPDGDYTPAAGARGRSEDVLYTSPRTGRTARYVVTMPPGYDLPENADARYPVTLLLHGYGQAPDDLPVAGALLAGAMTRGAWQKAILVYPDGACGRTVLRQCNDGVDNDGDGALDAASAERRVCDPGAPDCDDGYACRAAGDSAWCCPVDWPDCGPPDPQCARSDTPGEDGSRPSRCSDGVDNDRDGLVDLDDGGCMGDPAQDDEAECKRGGFYTTHPAGRDGEPGGPDYEALMLDLLDDVDRRYRTKAPAVFDHPAR